MEATGLTLISRRDGELCSRQLQSQHSDTHAVVMDRLTRLRMQAQQHRSPALVLIVV